MKSFKQFLNQDPDAASFLEMPLKIKASYFDPDSREQILFLQHTLDRNSKPESQASSHSPINNKREPDQI
jgi:hypothetical protein